MPTLEERIRKIAAAGELTHLSVIPVAHKGKIGWSATYAPASHFSRHIATAEDPVDALMQALSQSEARLRKKREATPPATGNPWD